MAMRPYGGGRPSARARLGKSLKAEIDPELIKAYRGSVWLAFKAGQHERVAVKIVDGRGTESLKLVEVN